jgi:hypothetical protein
MRTLSPANGWIFPIIAAIDLAPKLRTTSQVG